MHPQSTSPRCCSKCEAPLPADHPPRSLVCASCKAERYRTYQREWKRAHPLTEAQQARRKEVSERRFQDPAVVAHHKEVQRAYLQKPEIRARKRQYMYEYSHRRRDEERERRPKQIPFILTCCRCLDDFESRYPDTRFCSKNCGAKSRRLRNPEKFKAFSAASYQRHREKVKAKAIEYYWRNHEVALERKRHERLKYPDRHQARDDAARESGRAREMAAAWYAAHAQSQRAKASAWRMAHPGRAKQTGKAYREKHPDKVRASARLWRMANRERVRANHRAWSAKHPDWVHQKNHGRRAAVLGVGHEPYRRTEIFKRDKGICGICHQPVGEKWHIDHIIPVSKGGPDAPHNVQVAHPECNHRKWAHIWPSAYLAV
jgi:hypothetical protein